MNSLTDMTRHEYLQAKAYLHAIANLEEIGTSPDDDEIADMVRWLRESLYPVTTATLCVSVGSMTEKRFDAITRDDSDWGVDVNKAFEAVVKLMSAHKNDDGGIHEIALESLASGYLSESEESAA